MKMEAGMSSNDSVDFLEYLTIIAWMFDCFLTPVKMPSPKLHHHHRVSLARSENGTFKTRNGPAPPRFLPSSI